MTSLHLLLWIVGGIVLQLAIYLGIGFWQHWRRYQTLQHAVAAGDLPVAPVPDTLETEHLTAAWAGLRAFRVSHRVVEDAAQDIGSFYLVPQDGRALPAFLPGQFLTFRLDIPGASGRTEPLIRCYSLSDAPRPDGYRVSIKRAPAPANSHHAPGRSSNFFHDQVPVGSILQVRAPSGHFHIDRSDTPVVLVGGGIGITPMLSMLNWCVQAQPQREVWLFYGVRQRRELMAYDHLSALADMHPNFHLVICASQPGADEVPGQDYQHRGRIDVDLFRRLLPLKAYHFYICGPTPMLESLVPALEDWGVPDERIHFEAFGPASVKRRRAALAPTPDAVEASTATDLTVTFAKSGKQAAWSAGAGSLLELAEAHGIAIDSGCRAGSCGSCQTRIASGAVSYRQAPDFDPDPGTCLMCLCVPKTSVTLEL